MILSHCRCLVNHVFAIIALLHIRVLFVLIFLQTLSFGPDYLRTLLKYTGWPRLEMLPVQAVQYSVVVISMTTDKVRKVECPRLTQVHLAKVSVAVSRSYCQHTVLIWRPCLGLLLKGE